MRTCVGSHYKLDIVLDYAPTPTVGTWIDADP